MPYQVSDLMNIEGYQDSRQGGAIAGLPSYLTDLSFSTRIMPNSLQQISKSKCYEEWAFPTCAPRLWNSISLEIRKSNSFCAQLLLFRLLYTPEALCKTLVLGAQPELLNLDFKTEPSLIIGEPLNTYNDWYSIFGEKFTTS